MIRGMSMFLIDVAEWCVNALVLSMAFFFSAIAAFIFVLLTSVLKDACITLYKTITQRTTTWGN
jgi:F0F1-type ATP synthase membrane subunit a